MSYIVYDIKSTAEKTHRSIPASQTRASESFWSLSFSRSGEATPRAGHEIPLQGEARSREFPRPLEGDFHQDSGEMLPSMAACRKQHFSDSPMPSQWPSGSRISRALLGRRLDSIEPVRRLRRAISQRSCCTRAFFSVGYGTAP